MCNLTSYQNAFNLNQAYYTTELPHYTPFFTLQQAPQ